MDDSPQAVSSALSAIHAALLAGDFASMAALNQSLEHILSKPSGSLGKANVAALRALRSKAEENTVLLRAAQRGFRAAQRRIAEIRGVATGLTTYSAAGQRSTAVYGASSDHRA
jgi:hypothetical protein